MDFYQLLGVERGADEGEIKRAFRRLAVPLHPDKWPGDKVKLERFKDLSEAYETLSDPVRRNRYDSKRFAPQSVPGVDLQQTVTIPFMVAWRGGQGVVQLPTRRVTITIPPETYQGATLRCRGMGGPGDPPGDLLVSIIVQYPPEFTVEGTTLLTRLSVSWLAAYRGDMIQAPTPWGNVWIALQAGTYPGQQYKVAGHGVRFFGSQGDIIYTVALTTPPLGNADLIHALERLPHSGS